MLEYLDSLLTGAGRDLKLRTFKLVDQLSGRTMGIRADITPQVARIDAHLLNRRASPACVTATASSTPCRPPSRPAREPLQVGAELWLRRFEADLEIVRLLAGLNVAMPASRIDFGHVGIFRALAEAAGCPPRPRKPPRLLQAKDVPGLTAAPPWPEPYRGALLRPALYGGRGAGPGRPRLPPPAGHRRRSRACATWSPGRLDYPSSRSTFRTCGATTTTTVVFAAYCPDYPGGGGPGRALRRRRQGLRAGPADRVFPRSAGGRPPGGDRRGRRGYPRAPAEA